MRSLILFCFLCVFSRVSCSLRRVYPIRKHAIFSSNAGEPLFLSSYIESGNLEAGRTLAEVTLAGIQSYAGFFTVNKTTDSNLYLWFFPAEKSPETAPVVLWLQGGPGGSSLYGLFEEHGPFYFNKDGTLEKREYSWTKELNVLYIDNPVGTGFSFTGSDTGYAKDEIKVGQDLYSALDQFFKLFPEYGDNHFFITGESYAGKYVPAAAYAIHKKNQISSSQINLKGIAIGNGLTDPENMMDYGDHLYHLGLLDSNGRDVFKKIEAKIIDDIKIGRFEEAYDSFDHLLNGDTTPQSVFNNYTGFSYYYNFLHDKDYGDHGDVGLYIQTEEMRRAIHVGNLTYHSGTKVEEFLKGDVMQTVRPWVEILLENYKVLFYSGQLDVIVPYQMTENFLGKLEWSGSELYKTAERRQWRVNGELAGYAKLAGSLTEVLVRNAGHMVPTDQPLWAFDLIKRFTFNLPF